MIEQCIECNSKNIEFSEAIGEMTCGDCGLVLMDKLIEEKTFSLDHETAKTGLGNTTNWTYSDISKFRRGSNTSIFRAKRYYENQSVSYVRFMRLANAYLSNYSISPDIRKRVPKYYSTITQKNRMTTVPMEVRAAGLTYFILKELNIAVIPQDHAKHTGVPMKQLIRFSKLTAKALNKPYVFSSTNINGLIDKAAGNFINPNNEYIGNVKKFCQVMERKFNDRNLRFGKPSIASCFYIVSVVTREGYTQAKIAEATGVSEVTIRNNNKNIFDMLGIKKDKLEYVIFSELLR